jgi:hypothetical protein
MMHTAVSRAAAVVLAAAFVFAAPGPLQGAQRTPAAAARQTAQPVFPEAASIGDEQPAERTRELLEQIFTRYPPAVARVFKLDPSLMTNTSYLAPYPLLGNFLAQHPEVVHNPAYFLDRISNSDNYYNDPRRGEREQTLGVLAGIAVFIAFIVVVGVVTWLIRLVVTHRRWNRLSKVQFDTHSKLLDRFTSNDELLAYVQTPAGRRFLEFAPVPMQEAERTIAAPFSRILWSAQAGIVLVVLGLGLLLMSRQFTENADAAQLVTGGGILTLALGAGFIVSAIAAYGLSRKLGLFDLPASDHA